MRTPTLLALSLCLAAGAPALCDEPAAATVGSITNVSGEAFIVRGEERTPAEKGARLMRSDVLQTGEGGAVAAVLRDDTTLSLGPSSEMKMSEFQFEPDRSLLGLTVNLMKGTLVYVSGQITKLAPGSARIETPTGVAAVRGTKLLVEVH